ncbi:MAG: UDP-N-acetylglucosamine--N-acetylmuramyl-(pentapeptide) pyrophosphoryl-undecaprenol N-acetylglucosamine transferase [Patescibacteria group bacterium]|nr:UDP-N-acetylglucosamine--N-acetylmuramyl-(pentapeptide) pyrophosphoryl-undecaprenol N-acetylglucosamine transferase [Patescibacteria group bacterium]
MKILLTGGGTGGHFYPLIAIAEQINEITTQEKLFDLKLYYMSSSPYDKKILQENNITFVQTPAGKLRRYFSIKSIFDIFNTGLGVIVGLLRVFSIYPDVIISKGGYASFPTVFAGKILKIPVIIHESDSAPGKLNLWASKFARRIAVSHREAGEKFPAEKTAWTGQPIRKSITKPAGPESFDFFKLTSSIPTILILGGSQGAQTVNNIIMLALPELIKKYQIIHQTGKNNLKDVTLRSNLILENSPYKARYLPFDFLNDLNTKMAAGASSLVISRAGSAIFEIASWGRPSLIIPITNSNGDHQRKNAFNYARTGACEVIEEGNLTPHILISEIDKIISSKERLKSMSQKAIDFSTPHAGAKIAQEALRIALKHES